MQRLIFPRSNSSLVSCHGKAFVSSVLRLRRRKSMFLVDAGLGTPRICMHDEVIGIQANQISRFENLVGSLNVGDGKSLVKRRTSTGFPSMLTSLDVGAGESLVLPRQFRSFLASMELQQIWRTNKKVKGVILEQVKGGYSVAIAGFITFLPFRFLKTRGRKNDLFTIDSFQPQNRIVVSLENH